MRSFDLSPLLRSSVGFDRFNRLLDTATRLDEVAGGYPPYNIEKQGENSYRVTLAVAGFTEDELNITVQENTLFVSGKAKAEGDAGEVKYLHRGIARRAFERRFELADTVNVTGAGLENGLLHIDLVRVVPEEAKPRKIKIDTKPADQPKVIDSQAA